MMIRMSTDQLLEARHEAKLQWFEPWPACGPEGNELSAHISLQATVHDCINLARSVAKSKGLPTMCNYRELLLDFMAVHWAKVVE